MDRHLLHAVSVWSMEHATLLALAAGSVGPLRVIIT